MTSTDHSFPMPGHAETRCRSTLGAAIGLAAVALALSSCGVGGEPVDAGVTPSTAEGTGCPTWAADIIESPPADSGIDEDGWREHFLQRSVELAAAAEQLPAADAAVIDAYADAVRDFGNDPMAPGASRQMGEAAADAAAVAARAC